LAAYAPETTKDCLKDIGETAHIVGIKTGSAPRNPSLTKAVITIAGFWFRENFVGAVNFFEVFLGSWFFVNIGMVFSGETTIGAFDVFFAGISRDT
jgi:hypothetical protein